MRGGVSPPVSATPDKKKKKKKGIFIVMIIIITIIGLLSLVNKYISRSFEL